MTSQGQRFRRRALRRGYKVDEVDSFLDRVEATLAGEQVGAPVTPQDVHDVVFRVRFGGYDEWQVDLHLDRVERQLAELHERGGHAPDPRMDRMGSTMGGGMGGDRMAERPGAPMNRMAPPPERLAAPVRDERPMSPPPPMMPPPMAPRPGPAMPAPAPAPDPYGRYDVPPPPYSPPPQQQAPYDTGGFERYEQGRHGRSDMTAEMRMPERDNRGPYGSPLGGGPTPMSGPPMPTAPMSGPPMGPPMGGPPMGGPPMGGDAYRVDQLRRTFQPRRFGSGYDPAQVDRLFDDILTAMSGRGPMPVNENDLETLQFGLVPGGYFEAEVDAALREVRDILRRR